MISAYAEAYQITMPYIASSGSAKSFDVLGLLLQLETYLSIVIVENG